MGRYQKLKAAAIRFPVSVLFTVCLAALFLGEEINITQAATCGSK